MAAGTPDDKFQKLREENERRRKKKEEEEKRRKQEEEQKAKEALERRRQERLEQDERMRKPWQQPPAPKKPILRKGAKQKPVPPASSAVDPVRQSQGEEKRREWRQGLQDFIKQQRQQAAVSSKAQPAAAVAGADGAPVVPLTWEELRMAAEAGFDELLKQQEMQAEQRAAEEPTSRAARHRSPFKSPFRGAPAPPQETVQVALVPTQQYTGVPAAAAPPGPTHGSPRPSPRPSPRQAPDSSTGPGAAGAAAAGGGPAQHDSYKYSDTEDRMGPSAGGAGAPSTPAASGPPAPSQHPQSYPHADAGVDTGVSAPLADGGQQWRPQQHSADAPTGDAGVAGPPAAVLYPPAASNVSGRASWADSWAGLAGDAHAGVGGSGAGLVGSVASSGGLRRGVMSTARHRAAPADPSLLDLVTPSLPADSSSDPWVARTQPPASDGADEGAAAEEEGEEEEAMPLSPPRSSSGQRPPLPGPYDSPSQQQWPPAVPHPSPACAAPRPPPRLGLTDDPLEASLQAGGTLEALQQADGFRLTSPRPSATLLGSPPPQQQQHPQHQQQRLEASELQAAGSQSQAYFPDAQKSCSVQAESAPPPPQVQQPARQDQRQVRRGWGMPPQPQPGAAAAAAAPPYAAPAGPSDAYTSLQADPAPPPWARDSFQGVAQGTEAPVVPPGCSQNAPFPGGDWRHGSAPGACTGRGSESASVQPRSPAAIRHSVAVGDSGGPEMWQRESLVLQAHSPPLPPFPHAALARPVPDDVPPSRPQSCNDDGAPLPSSISAVSLSERTEQLQAAPARAQSATDWPAPPLTGRDMAAAAGAGSGRVDMSADLVCFSSPLVGPSRAASDSSSLSASPPQPLKHELEAPQPDIEPRQQQQRQSRHRLSSVAYDDESPVVEAAAAADEGGGGSAARPVVSTSEGDPWVGQATGMYASQQEDSSDPRDNVPLEASSACFDAPEPAAQPAPRSSTSKPLPQAPGPLLPPIPSTGWPPSVQSVRLSSSGGQGVPPVSLPPLTHHSQQLVAADGDAASAIALAEPQQEPLQQQQQSYVPPFRAPSPPASPPRSSGVAQRFHRQHSGASLLASVGLLSGGGSGSGGGGGGCLPTRPLSADGPGFGSDVAPVAGGATATGVHPAAVPVPSLPPTPLPPPAPSPPTAPSSQLTPSPLRRERETQQVQQATPAGALPPGLGPPPQPAAAFAAPQLPLQQVKRHRPSQPAPERQRPAASEQLQQPQQPTQPRPPPPQVDSGAHPSQAAGLTDDVAVAAAAAGPRKPCLVTTTPTSPGFRSPTNPPAATAAAQQPNTAQPQLQPAAAASLPRSEPQPLHPQIAADTGPAGCSVWLNPSVAVEARDTLASRGTVARESRAQEPPVVAEEPSEERAGSAAGDAAPAVGGFGAAMRGLTYDNPETFQSEVEVEGGELEGALDMEEEGCGGGDGDGDGASAWNAAMEGSLERPPGTAEGSVMTGSHISARPWSGPSAGPGGSSARSAAGSGYPGCLLDDSVSSFDFRLRSAATSRPASASCAPLPPAPSSSLPYPTAAAATATATASPSRPAAAAAAAGTTKPLFTHAPLPAAADVGSPAIAAGWQAAHPVEEPVVMRREHLAVAHMTPAGRGLVATHGSAAVPGHVPRGGRAAAAAAVPPPPPPTHTFQVLQQTAGGGFSGGSDLYGVGGGDDADGDVPTFVEEPVGEPDAPACSDPTATAVGLAAPARTAAGNAAVAPEDPSMEALMREIQELSALRKALKNEFEIMGRGDVVAGLNTLSANFQGPPQPPSAAAAAAEPLDGFGYGEAAATAAPRPPLTAAPSPLLQWNLPASRGAAPPAPTAAAPPSAVPAAPPVTTAAPTRQPDALHQARPPGPPGPWSQAVAAPHGPQEGPQLDSFAFASPGAPGVDSIGVAAGSGGRGSDAAPGQAAPLIVVPPVVPVPVPAPAPAPAPQPALQWTISMNGGNASGVTAAWARSSSSSSNGGGSGSLASVSTTAPATGSATSTPRKAAAPQPQPKRSPAAGSYAAPPAAATDNPGSGPRRTGGTIGPPAGATPTGGRQAAFATVSSPAAPPTERPLINEGSYALAAVQARERAERERAAREVLQAESAAAKAAIMQRSKSERTGTGGATAAAATPSAAGATKEASPLGPKAPSTIGSYVRQPSPARGAPAARTSVGGSGGGDAACNAPGSEASETTPPTAAVKQAWGTPGGAARPSRIPTPPRPRDPAAASPPPPPSAAAAAPPPRPTREDSLGSDFDFLERASDVSDTETDSPEAYGVTSKASSPPPPRREAFASPSAAAPAAVAAAAAASTAYRERLAEARPQPLRIPSSAAATPMGGASAASTVASRAVPTGGRGPSGGPAVGGGRPGGKGPSTPFTAAIRELMGLPGSAPLEQSRAAAGKQQQQHQHQHQHQQSGAAARDQPHGPGAAARAGAGMLSGPGAAAGAGMVSGPGAAAGVAPIRLLEDEEDKLLASLKRLDADILRRGLVVAGIINDPQLPPSAPMQPGAPAAAKGGAGKAAAAARGVAAKGAAPSPLTNSLQQDRLRDSLDKLDVRLAALRRKIEERAGSPGAPTAAAAAGAVASPQRPGETTPPREERRGPPATLAKSRTPTPNKAKAIRNQRQQQLSAGQGPTPPPVRAPAPTAAQPPKPASAPTIGSMGATVAAAAAAAAVEPQPPHQLLPPAAAAAGAPPLGMPPRAPASKAPSSAPSGAAAMNAAQQQLQLQQQQQQQLQLQQQRQQQQQMMAAAAAGGMPFGMMFAPSPQLLQQQQPGSSPAPAVAQQQQVAYVPAMMPNGQMAYVPQYVQPGGGAAAAAGGFPGFFPGAAAFGPPGALQLQMPPQQQQQQSGMVAPMMLMMQPGQQQPGEMPAGGVFPGMQMQQMPGGGGPPLAWAAGPAPPAAAPPALQQQQQQQQMQTQQVQNWPSYGSGGGISGGGGGPSLYSFDRSGPDGHGRGSQDGSGSGFGTGQFQLQLQQQHQQQQQAAPPLPYATGPPPSGPMPHYQSTVMRSRSIGSREGEALAAVAAAAGLTNQNHQHHQSHHHHHQPHSHDPLQSQQGHSHPYGVPQQQQQQQAPYGDQQVAVPQQPREPYPDQLHPDHHRQGPGQVHGASSQAHPVQVQSFGPNGTSRGLGPGVGGWGMAGPGGGGTAGSGGDAGVIKAVNLGLLLS